MVPMCGIETASPQVLEVFDPIWHVGERQRSPSNLVKMLALNNRLSYLFANWNTRLPVIRQLDAVSDELGQ